MRSWDQPDARLAAPGKRRGPWTVSGVGIEVLTVGDDVSVQAKRGVGERRAFGTVRAAQKVLDTIPAGRVGQADDVVGAAAFLASPAAAYISGQVIHVNGGWWFGS